MSNSSKIKVDLVIVPGNNKVVADLKFTNTGKDSVYIDKFLIGYEGELSADVFGIEDSDGKKIQYSGPMVKRHPEEADFILLTPGKYIESKPNIEHSYPFVKGNNYTIHYEAYHQSPKDDGVLNELVSGEVFFKY